jgi:hypothetical protein
MPLRIEALETAKELICGDRETDYGDPGEHFQVVAGLWSAYLGHLVWANDVPAMLALLKIARLKQSPAKEDNWIDLAGYAALGYEVSTQIHTADE